MAETNLRKASASTDRLEDSLRGVSKGQVSIKSVDSKTVEPIVEQYPFRTQDIILGRLSYKEESNYTSGRTIPVDFQFRTGSNLFLTEVQTDIPSLDLVTTQFTEATSRALKIYRNLHAPEDALWDFLMIADRILEITVLDQGEEVRYEDVDGVDREDVVGGYAIESASVGFVEKGNEIFVEYRGGSIQVESEWELGREYIVQTFEREVLSE
ncbi:hypothetical protein G6M89_07155 [Natronolimnobius sp. AArcel1]|uniref:hypothetical protein n=1 Tax=Natronolimnobius sp. AArcel1 TaxID=1679093 RepID=UPI0013E9EE2B|nr:hypothetical protein [Natronolimnobius sp. AArcel1]NGM68787.1 hypothetical protein [Natronolimnobius sp. AArcel1]